MSSDYERIGAERMRALIADFVGTMVRDPMIGFHFRHVDEARLAELELQFASRALGAEVTYEGRPLRKAHAPHRIFGGQFVRRRRLLEEAMARHGVDGDIQARWLAHVDALREQVTYQGGDCVDPVSEGPLMVSWRPEGDAQKAGKEG